MLIIASYTASRVFLEYFYLVKPTQNAIKYKWIIERLSSKYILQLISNTKRIWSMKIIWKNNTLTF
jgi:hypothetical protein